MSKTSSFAGAPPYSELVAEDGTTWLEYRKRLVPDFRKAWLGVAFCFAMIFGVFALEITDNLWWGNRAGLIAAPFVAIWIGFWLHALNQFAHEGAHGHLHPKRKVNDLLADWVLWPFFAQPIRAYRKRHMQHHVHLGDQLDTEVAYRDCMSPWFLFRTVTGIHLLVLLHRQLIKPAPASPVVDRKGESSSMERVIAVTRTALVHGALIAIPLRFGLLGASAAWAFGVFLMYPCFGTIRPQLEHRDLAASCKTDFSRVDHGPVNRHFGNDVFSRWFGAAGVNKHLLHHLDPSVSYTRFPEMEAFLLRTPHAEHIESNRTTYWRAARQMVAKALSS